MTREEGHQMTREVVSWWHNVTRLWHRVIQLFPMLPNPKFYLIRLTFTLFLCISCSLLEHFDAPATHTYKYYRKAHWLHVPDLAAFTIDRKSRVQVNIACLFPSLKPMHFINFDKTALYCLSVLTTHFKPHELHWVSVMCPLTNKPMWQSESPHEHCLCWTTNHLFKPF